MISEKICPVCKILKLAQDYSISRSTVTGINWACKICHNLYVSKRYKRLKKDGGLVSSLLAKELKDTPCLDCGILYPYHVMDFDHRPEENKLFGLAKIGGRLATEYRMKKVRLEVSKCDYICANCHRVRTEERHGKNM